MGISAPEPLKQDCITEFFDCKKSTLDQWLKSKAYKNQLINASKTYVVCNDERHVVGYYCLSTSAVMSKEVSSAVRRNMPDPIPGVLLGRLAVDHRYQGKGIGPALLKDAILRTLQVAETVAVKVLITHPLDENAAAFYQKFGFKTSTHSPSLMFFPIDKMQKNND